ncbi:MAG: hypothetical protein E7347_04555 [Clostridiales bacterium]|nr:hypothetical protein [Clostridiales bacterium]
MSNEKMFVEREPYKAKDGNTYFSYFIKGVIRGKEVKIQIAPPNKDTDFGGYTVLDIVFGDSNVAELVVTPYEMKDEAGNIRTGNTYGVRNVDETGEVYECKIKPFRTSDKALIKMLIG